MSVDTSKRFWAVELIGSYFPDFDDWLRRTSNRGRFMECVQEALAGFTPSTIERACKSLLAGDPIKHSKLPFVVAKLAANYAARQEAARWRAVADGQETVRCRDCGDTGLVDILHPKTVAESLASMKVPAFPYAAVALCPCPAGQAKREVWLRADRQHRIEIVFYDPKRHIKRELGTLPGEQYLRLLCQVEKDLDVRVVDVRSPRDIASDLAERARLDDF